MSSAVTVNNVFKRYGRVEALQGVSLSVEPGELFGIIGPDGAGKTSLFRILTTLLLADEGTATVCGLDTAKDYKAIREPDQRHRRSHRKQHQLHPHSPSGHRHHLWHHHRCRHSGRHQVHRYRL